MSSGTSVKFNGRNHTVVNLLGLRTVLVLPIARVRPSGCKSKVPLLFFQALLAIWPIWAQISKNHNSGTATTLSKIVLNRDCAVQNSEVAKL